MDHPARQSQTQHEARGRLGLLWTIGAAVQLAFWGLDLVIVPEQRWPFLALRLGLVALGTLLVRAALASPSPRAFRRAVLAAMVLMTAVVPTMTFLMGGFGAVYSYFVPASLFPIAALWPWSRGDGLRYVGASLGYYFLGNAVVLARGQGPWLPALGPALFVATCGLFAALTIVFQERARQAERALREDLERANAELARRSEALQASLRELGQREDHIATIGRMTSDVLHDLRNPLAAILSLAQCALEDARDQGLAGLVDDLEAMVGSARRLRTLLEEIHAFARATTPRLHPEPIALGRLLETSLEALQPALRAAGLELDVRLDGCAGLEVQADRDAFRRLLENLVRGVGAGRLAVRADAEERGVSLRLTTPGAPAGLGLVLARDMARAHGGGLTTEPAGPGGAVSHRLSLPAAPRS